MQSFDSVSVLLVDQSDYKTFIGSGWGLDRKVYDRYDVIIDRETGRLIKAVFHTE